MEEFMDDHDYIVDVDHLWIRFNLASQKVDNLKEYAIKMLKHELMFQEFFALQDVSLKVKKGEAWGDWNERFRQVDAFENDQRNFEAV